MLASFRAQTVGELCNTLSLFGGSPVDQLINGIDGPRVEDLNASLESQGLVGTNTLLVTFRRSHPTPLRVETSSASEQDGPTQSLFRTVEAAFTATPFGLELEVRF